MAKFTMTPEQQAKAAARRERFRVLAEQIGNMDEDERAKLAMQCGIATVAGAPLSVFNMCLVAAQCPTATLVGGFHQWASVGRCPQGRRGPEHLVPHETQGEGRRRREHNAAGLRHGHGVRRVPD